MQPLLPIPASHLKYRHLWTMQVLGGKRPRGGQAIFMAPADIKRLKSRFARRRLAAGMQAQFLRGHHRTGGFYGRYAGPSQEMKFHDLDIDDTPVPSAGAITDSVNKIPQGVTEVQRVGRKCVIKQISWRFEIQLTATAVATETSDIVRVLLYLDKQCNGATAAIGEILETADYQSFNNLANKSRFRTLMDRTYAITCTAGSGRGSTDTLSYGESTLVDDFYKKCNIPIEFDASNGAITEIKSNNIGVLLISKDDNPNFRSKMRLRFADN